MEIRKIKENKKDFLDLLLLADEQESMIDRYLERGEMFALYDDDLKSICVVTNEDHGVYELKNLATDQKYQRRGYGRELVDYICKYYGGGCETMLVGTGDTPAIITFYERCGFVLSHRIKNFFIDNYDHPIYENGIQLIDMVYMKKDLQNV